MWRARHILGGTALAALALPVWAGLDCGWTEDSAGMSDRTSAPALAWRTTASRSTDIARVIRQPGECHAVRHVTGPETDRAAFFDHLERMQITSDGAVARTRREWGALVVEATALEVDPVDFPFTATFTVVQPRPAAGE